ncbi:MAG: hypothetical protein HY401_01840 [Elusimicrobia bacterium]|nr:hypothetical protein [Elusimicrobiota bacterium]
MTFKRGSFKINRRTSDNMFKPFFASTFFLFWAAMTQAQETQANKSAETRGEVVAITAENYQKEVLESKLPVVLDYFSVWCPPCQVARPIFEEVTRKYAGRVKFGRVDGDKDEKFADQQKIEIYPTFVFINNGREVFRAGGGPRNDKQSKNEFRQGLKEAIEKYLLAR